MSQEIAFLKNFIDAWSTAGADVLEHEGHSHSSGDVWIDCEYKSYYFLWQIKRNPETK